MCSFGDVLEALLTPQGSAERTALSLQDLFRLRACRRLRGRVQQAFALPRTAVVSTKALAESRRETQSPRLRRESRQ